MNIFATIEGVIYRHLEAMQKTGDLPADLDFSRVSVETPTDPTHGDMATNAAMVLAKTSGQKPRLLAEKLAERLGQEADIRKAEIAGPGFINLTLQPEIWRNQLPHILAAGTDYGKCTIGQGETANIEYVSANPTGPMHVGHARGAVFGDALARLLARAGYEVTREYYINDAGQQVELLAQSVLLRAREAQGEAIGDQFAAMQGELYQGEYLKQLGVAFAKKHGKTLFKQDTATQAQAAKDFALPLMMDGIKDDLAALGIRHDVFVAETKLHADGVIGQAAKKLEEKGLVYRGVLAPPKGKASHAEQTAQQENTQQNKENEPQMLFKSTQFGDDSDRVLQRSDGQWTYFAADIAYHWDKIQRGFAVLINVWGADHGGYVKRLQSALAALTDGKARLDVKICQLVRLMRDKQQIKMSKRSGEFITLREVVDEVGKDAMRFMMLTRKNDAPLDFDFAAVMEKSRDNPVFYVQYAYARICSVCRQASALAGLAEAAFTDESLAKAEFSALTDPAEMAVLRRLAAFPRIIERAAQTHEPHKIAFFLSALAADFHHLWNAGKMDESLKFVQKDDKNVTLARLALIRATAITLACGFDILGVTPQETM